MTKVLYTFFISHTCFNGYSEMIAKCDISFECASDKTIVKRNKEYMNCTT